MDARIRFGNELDIARAIDHDFQPIQAKREGRIVLSFSNRVRNLPDEPDFTTVMDQLEIGFQDHGPAREIEATAGGMTLNGNRVVEVQLPIGREQVIMMGRALVRLARAKGRLGQNDVLFIDHTMDPAGRPLRDFEVLLVSQREERIREDLRHIYGLDEREIDRLFRSFKGLSVSR